MVITALWVIALIAFVLVFEGFLYAVLLAVALVCVVGCWQRNERARINRDFSEED